MDTIKKSLSLLVILLLSMSILTLTKSTLAQSTPTPPIPQFTARFIGQPYDVPTTHSIDPYTGENVTHEGYHVNNGTISLSIKNPPFNALSGGKNYYLYYGIYSMGHFQNDTVTESPAPNTQPSSSLPYPEASNSQYTELAFNADQYIAGPQIDYRVYSIIATDVEHLVYRNNFNPTLGGYNETWRQVVSRSNYSEPQTVTIPPAPAPTSTAKPNGTASDNEAITNLVLIIVVAVLVIVVILWLLNTKKIKPPVRTMSR